MQAQNAFTTAFVSTLRTFGRKNAVRAAAAASLAVMAGMAGAAVVPFSMSGTYSQGGSSDLSSTTVSLGGAGSFTLDPGSSSAYFDFMKPGGGTFSTINTQVFGYYFLRSYAAGDLIGAGTFGAQASSVDDWDAILVDGQTAGAWGASHNGYLGFRTLAGNYGWVQYGFTRQGGISTINFQRGAYDDVAGTAVTAGPAQSLAQTSAVPEPGSLALVGAALLVAGLARRRA